MGGNLDRHASSSDFETDDRRHPLGHLPDWWRVLVRRRWTALICLAVVVVASALYTFLSTPLYRATAVLQISPRNPSVLAKEDITAVDPSYTPYYEKFYQTQLLILKSRRVVQLAAERLDLQNHPEFANRKTKPIRRLFRWAASDEPVSPEQAAAGFIEAGLEVQPVRLTQLVRLSFTDRSPELARDVANAVAEAYIQFDYSSFHDTTNLAREFLTKEVARAQREIADLEHQLQAYSSENELIAASDGIQDISEQAFAELNARYIQTLGRLVAAEANLETVQNSPPDALPEVLNSSLVVGLKQEYARIERRNGQLSERFKPGWPALAQAEQELQQAGERLELETASIAQQVRDAARADYERATAELSRLEQQLAEQKIEVKRVKRAAVEYAGLKAAIETKRNVLGDLVARASQTDTSVRLSDSDKKNIRFIERAEEAFRSSPRTVRNLLLGILAGALLGIFAALGIDFLDNSVKNESDLERCSGLPVLSYIPLFQSLRVVREGDGEGSPPLSAALASHFDSRSGFVEAFKNLRTSLLLALPDHPPRSIVVTSCEATDGKSTVSVNLAIVLAQLGRRVLLVDADLRRPRLQEVLGLSMDTGLSSLLSGNAGADDVFQETEIPGVVAVSCGPIPPNPTELVSSPALASFIEHSTGKHGFEHVIFDSPPLVSFSDPVTLASKVDATVLVVRAGKTSRASLAHGVARLQQAKARVTGAVLNGVSEKDQYYYYGQYYHYAQPETDGKSVKPSASPRRSLLGRRRGRVG